LLVKRTQVRKTIGPCRVTMAAKSAAAREALYFASKSASVTVQTTPRDIRDLEWAVGVQSEMGWAIGSRLGTWATGRLGDWATA
jgi:hypothetical protein